MGKSNNIYNNFEKVYQRDNHLSSFLKEDEIQELENINNCFINQFIIDFSNFIKKNVQLVSYSIKIASNEKNIDNFKTANLLEILPYKSQSFIVLSSNFLSFIIDLLFGGRGNLIKNTIDTKTDVTSTEFFLNKKIIKFIINIFSNVCQKHFSSEIKFINLKIIIDFKKPNFDFNKIFIINCFNLNINNVNIFFSILIPLSIFKEIKNKTVSLIKDNNKNISTNKKNESKISFNDIYDIELNISARIIDFSISYDKFYSLSEGDILPITKPDKILGFIENKPIFFGNYNRFNEQTVVFIKKFIDSDLESNKDKEYFNE